MANPKIELNQPRTVTAIHKIKRAFTSLYKTFVYFLMKVFLHPSVAFYRRFREGSVHTKFSHIIMGYGNLTRRQFAKGFLYLALQLLFLFVFISSPKVNDTPIGFKAIYNFITLGTVEGDIFTPTDNSMLMLLFGILTFGLIVGFLIVYHVSIQSSVVNDKRIKEGKNLTTFKEDLATLLDEKFHVTMLTPTFIGVTAFTLVPTIFMILIAFTNFGANITPGQQLFEWVGFDNFKGIVGGAGEIAVRFWPVTTWTLTWAIFATFSNYIAGILLAMLINRNSIKFKKVWRTVFIMTIAIPQFVSLLAVRNLLSELGPINGMLLSLGLVDDPIQFLSTATNAMTPRITVLIINLWVGIPFTMLMTSGILMNIPKDLYEAATVDGANKRQLFRNITVPYVFFVTTPYLITAFVGNITSFNIIYLLTGGGPSLEPGYVAGSTDLLVTWLYKLTIDSNEYNIGSVIAIMTFILTATGTLLSYRKSKAYKEEDAFQ
jgi:arabinogalactan oligomer/maltooligosaccharide transport system permease protein